jgi:hypothetical protein
MFYYRANSNYLNLSILLCSSPFDANINTVSHSFEGSLGEADILTTNKSRISHISSNVRGYSKKLRVFLSFLQTTLHSNQPFTRQFNAADLFLGNS